MKWFKHMSDASNDLKLIKVEERFGLLGYAAYWKIVEYCARQWKKGKPPEFEITQKHLNLLIRMKSVGSEVVINYLSELLLFQISKTDNGYLINFPKLLDIRDEENSRGAKNSGVTRDKLRVELELEKEKEKDIYNKPLVKRPRSSASKSVYGVIDAFASCDSVTLCLLSKIRPEIQDNLFKKFPDIDWLKGEFYSINNWIIENPKKVHSRTRWGIFVDNWLSKNWPKYLRDLQSNKTGKVLKLTAADLTD